mmetsp:Transcript_49954/g.121024  ORF Transcript_49954/g.121024 Transcript_49954/m.121024 type:complete len:427 (-) Transcript_49954:176-1456(-)
MTKPIIMKKKGGGSGGSAGSGGSGGSGGNGNGSGSSSKRFSTVQVLLIVCGALLFQSMYFTVQHGHKGDGLFIATTTSTNTDHAAADALLKSSFLSPSSSSVGGDGNTKIIQQLLRETNPLMIPPGQAQNLPSVRHNDENINSQRNIYGGHGDGKHLGGFTEIDMMGLSPVVWKYMVQNMTIKSVLDVGCGRGISTSWFYAHGLRVQCAEGSHDAVLKTMIPDKSLVTEHDFSRGPWWPQKTFDAVWAVEFLEHVGVQYHYNYISAFRKAAILMVTSSRWGGWHHVEVHPDEWWIKKYEMYGFKYSEDLTKQVRQLASREAMRGEVFPPTGKKFAAQHVFTSMKVFINPVVASLPEHAHLFSNHGCYKGPGPGGISDIVNRECGTGKSRGAEETKVDPSFLPLNIKEEQDLEWYNIVEKNVDKSKI